MEATNTLIKSNSLPKKELKKCFARILLSGHVMSKPYQDAQPTLQSTLPLLVHMAESWAWIFQKEATWVTDFIHHLRKSQLHRFTLRACHTVLLLRPALLTMICCITTPSSSDQRWLLLEPPATQEILTTSASERSVMMLALFCWQTWPMSLVS